MKSELSSNIYLYREYSVALRRLGLAVRQVRGISRDESNALTRLADAIAGFVRDALEEKSAEIRELFREAELKGVLIEVETKKPPTKGW